MQTGEENFFAWHMHSDNAPSHFKSRITMNYLTTLPSRLASWALASGQVTQKGVKLAEAARSKEREAAQTAAALEVSATAALRAMQAEEASMAGATEAEDAWVAEATAAVEAAQSKAAAAATAAEEAVATAAAATAARKEVEQTYARSFSVYWEFGAPGHGKGVWDGIGAWMKRTVRQDIVDHRPPRLSTIRTATGSILTPEQVHEHLNASFNTDEYVASHRHGTIKQAHCGRASNRRPA